MTPRGIAALEEHIRTFLPYLALDTFQLDPRRFHIVVLDVSLSSDRKFLEVYLGLRFLPGTLFCCSEPGCHGLFHDPGAVQDLRRGLVKRAGLPRSFGLSLEVTSLRELGQFRI